MTREPAEAAAIVVLTSRLHAKQPGIPLSVIEQIVSEIYAGYDGSRVRDFVPLLVERESRERVAALPDPEGLVLAARSAGSPSSPSS